MPRCHYAAQRRRPRPPAQYSLGLGNPGFAQLSSNQANFLCNQPSSLLRAQQESLNAASVGGALHGVFHLNEQHANLGMRQAMLNPSAWAQQTDLNKRADGSNVDPIRKEPRQLGVWRMHVRQLAMRVSKLAQKVANLFRVEGA